MMRQFFSFVILSFFLVVPVFSAWAGITCPAGFNDNTGAGVCIPTGSGLSQASVLFVFQNFMNWLLGILGVIGIIAFVISGMQYLLSAGDDDTISLAKRNMKYSIIGVIVALSGFVVIQAVDSALSATSTIF